MTHSLILECHHNGSMSALHRLRTEIQIQNNTNTHLKKEEGYNTKTHTSFHVTQVQLAKSSHAINGGAIFSAVSSLKITSDYCFSIMTSQNSIVRFFGGNNCVTKYQTLIFLYAEVQGG